MKRRDFLKALGLGGVALTVPLSRKVVAASMADLKAPPLHAGYCELGPLSTSEQVFTLYGVTMHVEGREPGLPKLDRIREFYDKWMLHLFFRKGASKSRIHWLSVPTAYVPDPVWEGSIFQEGIGRGQTLEHQYVSPQFYRAGPNETAECWLTPNRVQSQIQFPLPKVQVALKGTWLKKGHRLARKYAFINTFDRVSLDRAQAIKLGLLDPKVELFKEIMEG